MSNTTSIAAIAAAVGALALAGCATSTPSAPSDPAAQIASSAAPPASMGCNAAELQQVLQRVNEARQAGMCGDARLGPARPLAWQPSLAAAASRRAGEIAAQRGSFGKVTDVSPRLRQQGYQATAAQESQAAGDYSSNGAALALLGQQKQCTALLNPAYTDMGAACVTRPGSEFRHYWTVVVAQGTQTQAAMGAGPATKASAKKASARTATPKAAATKSAARKPKTRKASDHRLHGNGKSVSSPRRQGPKASNSRPDAARTKSSSAAVQ